MVFVPKENNLICLVNFNCTFVCGTPFSDDSKHGQLTVDIKILPDKS